ncbi:MAG: hypothetical protein ACI9C2_000699 [Gammaproteobacteria bacterium]|jgi:hypothetical protein
MKKVLIGLGIIVALFVMVGALLTTEYVVEQRVTIKASPESIHALVGDLARWDDWAPWVEEDPSVVTTLGTTTGVGASQTWTSDEGDGELTFTASDPAKGIAYDMVFIMGETRAPATCAMTYEVDGENTTVVWTMEGDMEDSMPPVLSGYMTLMVAGSIGAMFDTGLAKLKSELE